MSHCSEHCDTWSSEQSRQCLHACTMPGNVGMQYASSACIMLICFGFTLYIPCRFAMMLEDMNITKWEIETGGALERSTADIFLADL